MRAVIACLAALLFACGELLDGEDAAIDARADSGPEVLAQTCTTGVFGPAVPLSQLNTALDDRDIRFSSDELTAAFARGGETDAGIPTANTNVLIAHRISLLTDFATPQLQPDVQYQAGYGAVYPSLRADALVLWVESNCDDYTGSGGGNACTPLQMAPFVPDAETYIDNGKAIFGLNEGDGPFGVGSKGGDGIVTNDAGAYYYAALVDSGARDAVFVAPGHVFFDYNVFATPHAVFVPADTTTFVDNPIVTVDELTMFVSTTTTTDPVRHVSATTRATTSDSFGPLTPVHEFDSTEGEYPSWISPDRCRLYLTRIIGGQRDLYVASRSE